jgi:hypothetical protein
MWTPNQNEPHEKLKAETKPSRGPLFELGDKQRLVLPESWLSRAKALNGHVGTIVFVPKRRGRHNTALFPGEYSYDVDFDGRLKRIGENHLELV